MSEENKTKTVTSPTPAEVTGQAPAEAKVDPMRDCEIMNPRVLISLSS